MCIIPTYSSKHVFVRMFKYAVKIRTSIKKLNTYSEKNKIKFYQVNWHCPVFRIRVCTICRPLRTINRKTYNNLLNILYINIIGYIQPIYSVGSMILEARVQL